MTGFTTRPPIMGTFGVVATTHYLASAIGFSVLERGGNAVDAACAAGFALQVAEPHLCGPAGEAPILIYQRAERRVVAISGQGVAPRAATITAFRKLGLDMIPGTGVLAATVPAAFDAWLTALRDYGTMSLADVLRPAIGLARDGVVLIPKAREAIATLTDLFKQEWPTSAAVYLPGGRVPPADAPFRNPELAATYERILDEEAAHRNKGRHAALEAARRAFYEGFVAEAIDRFLREAEVFDVTGKRHRGLLRGEDLAAYRGRIEEPVSLDYHGLAVHKCGPWSQGPVFLQQLALLQDADLVGMGLNSADYVHTLVEAGKLAFADREVYYGDPLFAQVPLEALLSPEYAARRRELIDPRHASLELRHGELPGVTPDLRFLELVQPEPEEGGIRRGKATPALEWHGVGEPATTPLGDVRGDTVHVDVIDAEGNMVASTPSGGWLQSSPAVPGLGFPLGTRAQMFWLVEGHPNSLAPGKRPRTTLTPTLVTRAREPYMAFGSPGGDQQDQWTLHTFLAHVHFGLNLQEAVELPGFHSLHFPSSFYPRTSEPGGLLVEERFPPEVLEELRRRGHKLTVAEPWSAGRQVAARIDVETGLRQAAASPRGYSGYAVGR